MPDNRSLSCISCKGGFETRPYQRAFHGMRYGGYRLFLRTF